MKLLRNSVIIFCGLLLSACNGEKPKLLINTKLVDRPELILPPVRPINQSNITWIVLTADNYERKMKELKATGNPVTLFALTSAGYKNLSLNVAELRKYIQQQNTVIVAYKKYYKNEEKSSEK